MTPPDLARVFRQDHGRVLAALIAQFRDFDLAEEALQAAFSRAAEKWPTDGMPDTPGAWLLTVARRQALDQIRKHQRQNTDAVHHTIALLSERDMSDQAQIPDERLRLIFTCCHPALAQDAQIALTLRTLGGLTVAEIARAYLTSQAALAKRLTRAKAKIRDAVIPYEVPEGPQLAARLPPVLAVIYLIYNESYMAYEGESLTRADLAEEALHLAGLLYRLLPTPETQGLLALILLHDARRPARSSPTGTLIPLEHQDRNLWDADKITRGRAHVLNALSQNRPGPYQVQAAISAVHADAADWAATDWTQIAGLYAALSDMQPSDVVTLNRAVALCQAGDLETAAELMTAIADSLSAYQPFFAARADLRQKQGAVQAARADLDHAIDLSRNVAEKRYLEQRRAAL